MLVHVDVAVHRQRAKRCHAADVCIALDIEFVGTGEIIAVDRQHRCIGTERTERMARTETG